MNTNIFLIELSPKLEDGSRKTLSEKVIATCKTYGDAQLILSLLRNNSGYKDLISPKKDYEHMYLLTAERRKPIKIS